MPTRQIIDGIQQRTGLEAPEKAHDLATAVLASLSRLDLGGHEYGFAAELPQEFSEVLLAGPDQKENLDANTFVRRVADHIDTSPEQSETWTRATLSLLVESVPTTQREKVRAVLPEDLYQFTIWDV